MPPRRTRPLPLILAADTRQNRRTPGSFASPESYLAIESVNGSIGCTLKRASARRSQPVETAVLRPEGFLPKLAASSATVCRVHPAAAPEPHPRQPSLEQTKKPHHMGKRG